MSHRRISIRPTRVGDATSEYVSWLSDPEVNCFLEVRHDPPDLDRLKLWIKVSESDDSRENFLVEDGGVPIGTASLINIDRINGTFGTGWMIGDKNYWGGTTSLQIMALLFEAGFGYSNMRKCFGRVYASHVKARMANRSIGMSEEARLEASHILDGNPEDTIIVTITRETWSAIRVEKLKQLGLLD